MAGEQRISYVPLDKMTPEMRAEIERCAESGTPRPESSAIRAHAPNAFWAFANGWRDVFHTGICDHAIKELARLYVSRAVTCEFCGNQRSAPLAGAAGVSEAKVDDLVNFEKSAKYSEREKAALAYAEAITWRIETDDAFWQRLRRHFSEPELVELGCFIALTMGQQSWLRMLNIDHYQVMASTAGSMAPGLETAEGLAKAKAAPDYWARKQARDKKRAEHQG